MPRTVSPACSMGPCFEAGSKERYCSPTALRLCTYTGEVRRHAGVVLERDVHPQPLALDGHLRHFADLDAAIRDLAPREEAARLRKEDVHRVAAPEDLVDEAEVRGADVHHAQRTQEHEGEQPDLDPAPHRRTSAQKAAEELAERRPARSAAARRPEPMPGSGFRQVRQRRLGRRCGSRLGLARALDIGSRAFSEHSGNEGSSAQSWSTASPAGAQIGAAGVERHSVTRSSSVVGSSPPSLTGVSLICILNTTFAKSPWMVSPASTGNG